ncbi:MAG: radical SAM protein [Candidatus Omnitrophica bacterium]|nr:radical SAM protein [Candidatus Omnitrophota bacterium]
MISLRRLSQYVGFMCSLQAAKLTKKRIPLIVILCVTNKCNLKCWYCYGEHPLKNAWQDFSTKELLIMIRTLRGLGTLILQLQGGEPLLRTDIRLIIEEAKKCGMLCDMVTNGILIPQKLDAVRLLDKICISLDGPARLTDSNRGEGVFDRVVTGISAASELGLPVRISAVLTQDTDTEDIDWLLDFCRKRSLLVNFSPSFDFIGQSRGSDFKPHIVADKKMRLLFQHILNCKKKGQAIQFSQKSYALALQWPLEYSNMTVQDSDSRTRRYPHCYHGDYIFFIDSDGSVRPCCNFWGRKSANIRVEGLSKAILLTERLGCGSCYVPAYIDRNLFFEGAISTWFNYIIHSLRGEA